jgi:hypothetical protein
MRTFKEADFTWTDSDLLVSEASYLGFPPDRALSEFAIAGLGAFEYQAKKHDTFVYVNETGLIAQIFND